MTSSHMVRRLAVVFCIAVAMMACCMSGSEAAQQHWPGKAWEKVDAAKVGLDAPRLKKMVSFVRKEYPKFRSLLLVYKGRKVVEEYFGGAGASHLQNVKSVTKSVMSALIGMAINDRAISSVEMPLSKVFPRELALVDEAKTKGAIRLKDLMTMRSGLDMDENSPGMGDVFSGYRSWVSSILKLPMARVSGGEFHYSTCDTHLLSCAFTRLVGRPLLDYAKVRLFKPLGITSYRWSTDPEGNSFGGSELFLTPDGMARFGYLYLMMGQWNQRQLVPRKWVIESTKDSFSPDDEKYGYLWWLRSSQGYRTIYASGYGGQYIFIVPELDMVMVTTQAISYEQDSRVYSAPMDLLDIFVVPSTPEWRVAQ